MKENDLVSIVFISYNQELFIRESVISALSQTYSPLEIIFSDDCSKDRTYEIICEEVSSYQGRHKIILNRNKNNLGVADNLNKAMELSRGKFIVQQEGDDISVPWRVEKLVRRWLDQKNHVDLVCSYFEEIDVNGIPTGYTKREVAFIPDTSKHVFEWRCGATGACTAFSRRLHEKYGELDNRLIAPDWVYPFRAWLESGIAVVEEPLVKHRTHIRSVSFIHRTLESIHNSRSRRLLRETAAKNRLAIAEEWLRAWEINDKMDKPHISSKLQNLIKLRKIQFNAFQSTRVESIKLLFQFILCGGGLVNAAKFAIRQVIRYD
jgi:glycosyltransferase involved in cell wall biosynthesis